MLKKFGGLALAVIFILALAFTVGAADGEVYTVVLDPGHGGSDPGTDVGTRYESEYNYDLALLLKKELEADGRFKVVLTRGKNEYKKYLERALVADKAGADLLVSMHFNSTLYSKNTVQGVEVFSSVLSEWSPDSLCISIAENMSKKCGLKNGGHKKQQDTGDSRGVYYWNEELGWDIPGVKSSRVSDYYSMISWGTKLGFPAIIVEHAYLSNPSDLALCDSESGLKLMAEAEAEAIIKYFTSHTHNYKKSTDRRANCCLGGVNSEKCTVCGHRRNITTTAVAPDVHGWTVDSRKVTCTSDGYVYRECQISRNLSEKGMANVKIHTQTETVSSPGHRMETLTDTKASHGVDGIFKEKCTVCGHVNEVVTEGDPHIYELTLSSPKSCTVNGRNVYKCTVCDDTYEVTIAAEGHNYVSGDEVLSCSSDGTKEYTCTVCGDVVSENIEVPSHKLVLTINSSPDCENDGLRRMTCTVCGYEKDQVLPKTGHDYDDGKVTSEADYFTEGMIHYVCRNDKSHTKDVTLPMKTGRNKIIAGIILGCTAATALIVLTLVLLARKKLKSIALEGAALLESMVEGTDSEEKSLENEEYETSEPEKEENSETAEEKAPQNTEIN